MSGSPLLLTRLAPLVAQWQSNRRLRVAVGLALLVAVAHVALTLGTAREATVRQYQADHQLRLRLEGAAADEAWSTRAAEARDMLTALEGSMVVVVGAGGAQAELQARLSALAAAAGLPDVRVRTEGAVPVDGLPDLWQGVARLDATVTPDTARGLLEGLARDPWIRVDRIELLDGEPGRVQAIVRGYFREAADEVTRE